MRCTKPIKLKCPKALVEEEIDRAVQTITQQLESQGLPAKDIDRAELC